MTSVPPSDPFGVALRELRMARGISLTKLAEKVNYSKSHLSRVEKGTKRATEWLVQRCDEVLEADGALIELSRRSPRTRPPSSTAQKPPIPSQLPHVVADFVGRANVVAQLDALLLPSGDTDSVAPVVLIDGPVAAGKTTTAVHWANRARHAFPDGILFADLNGFTLAHTPVNPAQLLRRFLTALGDNPDHLSDDVHNLGALFRTRLTGRRLLLLLDNTADAEQIRPLLPAAGGCAALVTSRNRMPGLVARDGVRRITLGPMSSDESFALLKQLLSSPLPLNTMRRITDLACRLPLPIRVAAARWETHNTWEALAGHDAMPLLTLLSADPDNATALRTLLSGSYQTLTPQAAQVFRLLGVGMHGPFTAQEASLLLGQDIPATRRSLDELINVHLISGGTPYYKFDAILRAFAIECIKQPSPP
ncbi:helix-turn-helix domain-containing protein [Streptomyces sp. NPDC056672]|uniref:helix-turn-helix domain-containing protein n=1 Tax=Streptomyces sp. NPDC056672 TaxID=3345906 RepID=UPI0036BB95B0